MIIISLFLLILGVLDENDMMILAAGLFAIAGSIDTFRYKYFKNK